MSTHEFKPGDRVCLAEPETYDERRGLVKGQTGTIAVASGDQSIAVEFEGFINGHDAGAADGSRSRWFVAPYQLELAEADHVDA